MPKIDSVSRAIGLVRRGDFIAAASDPLIMGDLAAVDAGADPASDQRWLTCQALLAEINDQTSRYATVADIFANEDVLRAVLRSLRASVEKYGAGKKVPAISSAERRLVRARALYVLQAGIHRLRKFDYNLDVALELMNECRQALEAVSAAQCEQHGPNHCRFHGVLSLVHYWQGRVEMGRDKAVEARKHFNTSMRETERNLDFHYSGASPGIRAGDERMAYASYSLASAMAFGVAHLNHGAGHLRQALALLRPASAMLMGTGDNYRRGYAQMLIGAAERALAGKNPKGLQKAIDILEESVRLFAGTPTHKLQHGLHQSRAHHQLAMAHTYLAQAQVRQVAKGAELRAAKDHWFRASKLLETFEDGGFGDPELRYDLHITGSRILREEKNYAKGRAAAWAALGIAKRYPYAPAFSRAKAHVAIAETLLDQSEHQPNNAGILVDADFHIKKAIETCQGNSVTAAVTHLYEVKILVRQKELRKARHKFHEAWHRRERHIQNGWARQLAAEIADSIKSPKSEFIVDLEELEKEVGGQAVHEPLWDNAIHELQRFMVAWAEETTDKEPYVRMGITKGRWFSIKKKLRT